MVMTGLEPTIPELLAQCSDQLNYKIVVNKSSDSLGIVFVVVTQIQSQSEYRQIHTSHASTNNNKEGQTLTSP